MESSSPVRVALIDDYEIVVAGLAAVLEPFSDKVEVVELDSQTPVVGDVDVALYDTFGQLQGSELDLDDLIGRGAPKVVVFSWNTDADLVRRSLANGVHGYVSKGVDADALVDAICRVHQGETVTPEEDHQPDGDRFGQWPGQAEGLTPREAEVLGLICQGLGNEEIGQRAFIGVNTVKTHIRTLYRKIGVTTRPQAVLWGVAHGFRPDHKRTFPPHH